MDFLPLFLNVRGRRAVVVGDGAVGARKQQLLREAGARVVVVRDWGSEGLAALAEAVVVIAATDDRGVNAAVSAAARARGIPVNVIDDPELSTFILPAVVDRSPVIVAVGTGGNAPVLARFVRTKIEALLSPQLGKLAALAGQWRERVKQSLRTVTQRRRFWERVFEGAVATHALAGREAQAEFELRRELKRSAGESATAASEGEGARKALAAQEGRGAGVGEVYLVGAGPGDPDLLTLKAVRLLQQADVILYDRLVSPEVLARARRDAELIYVGKEAGRQSVTQARIHELLVELARQGKRVCRLKGGDSFVFGRGGEELEVLAAHGIAFTVVPGITAALGAAASAGIALTHRDYAQSVSFVTGHTREGDEPIDWRALARTGHTSVFYMGVAQLRIIVAELAAAGAPLSRPAAVIERATFPDERVVVGTLADLVEKTAAAGVRSPALLIVGDVVALRAKLTGESRAVGVPADPVPHRRRA